MNLKRFAGLLLAVLTLCSPATTVSNAEEVISDESELNTLLSTTGGDGVVTSNITTTSQITAAVNSYLYSDVGSRSISGNTINISSGVDLNIKNLNISNLLNLSDTSKLIVENNTNGVALGQLTGSGDIIFKDGTISVSSITAKNLTNNSAATTITGNLKTTNNINISGGSLSAAQISSAGNVNVYGGTVNASSIGTSSDKVQGKYLQQNGTVTVSNINTVGNIQVDDGTLTTGNLNTEDTFTQNAGTVNLNASSKLSAKQVQLTNGNLNLGDASSVETTSDVFVNNNAKIQGSSATISSSGDYTQIGDGINVTIGTLKTVGTAYVGHDTGGIGGVLNAKQLNSKDYIQSGSQVTVDSMNVSDGDYGVLLRKFGSQKAQLSVNTLTADKVQLNDSEMTVSDKLTVTESVYVNNSTLTLNGNASAASYSQKNNSNLNIAANKSLTTKDSIGIEAGTVSMGANSSLSQTDSSGSIYVNGSAGISGQGIINAAGSYDQTTTGIVSVKQIFAGEGLSASDKGVSISNGTLLVQDIGTTAKRVGKYYQLGSANVTAEQIQTDGSVIVSGGSLTADKIGDTGYAVKSYSQNTDANTVKIGTGGLNSSGAISLTAGSLQVSGNITSSSGNYTQSGSSSLSVADGKKLDIAGLVSINDNAQLTLGTLSEINAKNGMNVSDSAKITDTSNTAKIKVVGNYTQEGNASDVAVNNLVTTGNVSIQAGNFSATNIGESDNKILSYSQGSATTSPTVSVDNIYASDNVLINKGTLDVKTNLNSDKNVTVGDGSLTIKNSLSAKELYSQTGGTVTLADGAKISAGNGIKMSGGEMLLGTGSVLSSTTGNANIELSGSAKINNSTVGKKGTIKAIGSYSQADGTTVYADEILANQNVTVTNSNLTANTIGSLSNPAGTYSQGGTSLSLTNVNAENIYADKIEISNGTLNLGKESTGSVLSAKTFDISGGTLNLYNTKFNAPSSVTTNETALTINGAVLNAYGTNDIGLYDTSKYIYTANIGNSKATRINVGDKDGISDILNVTAGSGNYNFGAYSETNINNDGILNLSSQMGNITYSDGSIINNSGQINISSGISDKYVSISGINAVETATGTINNIGNVQFTKNIYTDTYKQTAGKTTINEGAQLIAVNTGNAIDISGGVLEFNGAKGKVNAEKGTFRTQNVGTAINVVSGKESSVDAKSISISDTNITLEANTGLTLKPGTGNLSITGGSITGKSGSELKIDTSNGSALIQNNTISLEKASELSLQGNSNIVNSSLTIANDAVLSLNTNLGSISIDSDSDIINSGTINIDGDSRTNATTINASINNISSRYGDINKDGSSTLYLNNEVNTGSLKVSQGTVYINDNVNALKTVDFNGNNANNKYVTVTLAAEKSISSDGDLLIGSDEGYSTTTLNLEHDSKISGQEVYINGIVNAIKTTISAENNGGGNVTIGSKANLSIQHYDGDGDNITVTTLKGKNIKVSDGSNIDIQSGAKLEYIGTVISDDAHYRVDENAQWVATEGDYTKDEYMSAPGGAVLNNDGEVLLYDDVSFKNSSAYYNGGAIYNKGTVNAAFNPSLGAYAENISFENNKSGYAKDNTNTGTNGSGGAIYNSAEGIINLQGENLSFTNNKAAGEGGAIYNISTGLPDKNAVTIGNNSYFDNNVAIGNGGAIYAGNTGKISIGKNATFSNNRAGYDVNDRRKNSSDGGALYIDENATVSFGSGLSVIKNAAINNGSGIYNAGTLIFDATDLGINGNSAVFQQNGVFSGSVTTNAGGAIYNRGKIITKNEAGVEINGLYKVSFGSDKELDANRANYGGALYNEVAGDEILQITDSGFEQNVALKDGGAIYNKSGKIQINTNSFFTNNSALGNGGAIYNADNAQVILNKGLSIGYEGHGNTANQGGAIYNSKDANLVVSATKEEHVAINGNVAKVAGGAIYNEGYINKDADNLVEYIDFYNNKAGDTTEFIAGKGGAVYNEKATLKFENSVFENNEVSYRDARGGAIFNAKDSNITLGKETILKGNSAIGSLVDEKIFAKGGAVYNDGTLEILDKAVLQNNSTDGLGGAIFNAENAVTKISANVVIGGLLTEYTEEKNPTGGNEALKGGGIYNDNGKLTFDGTAYFIGNNAKNTAGAIYYKSASDLNTKNLVFYKNSVQINNKDEFGLGGAIYVDKDTTGNVTVSGSVFDSNSAQIGSAVYNASNNMFITGMSVSGDYLENYSSNSFKSNTVGSAIGNEGKLDLIPNFVFANNTYRNAGVLWNQEEGVINAAIDADISPYSMQIYQNGYTDAQGNGIVDGAGLHLQDKSTINTRIVSYKKNEVTNKYEIVESDRFENTIGNAVFSENTGHRGGAIYKSSEKDLDLINVTFGKNTASAETVNNENDGSGGAIYNIGSGSGNSNIYIDKSTIFRTNLATGKGGAIYNGYLGNIEFDAGYRFGADKEGYSNMAMVAGGSIANEGNLVFNVDPETNRSVYFTYEGAGASIGGSNAYNGNGGALYLGGKSQIYTKFGDDLSVGLNKAVFTNNESKNGGAIYNDTSTVGTLIKNTQFSGNRGYYSGGAVYNNAGSMSILLRDEENNIFRGNQAGNDIPDIAMSGKGGAIYNAAQDEKVLTISQIFDPNNPKENSDRIFVSNSAIGENASGGAIYNASGADMIINPRVSFYQNSSGKNGGAISTAGSLDLNLAEAYFNSDGEKVIQKDIVFSQNTAKQGSAIYIENGGQVTIGTKVQGEGTLTFVDEDKENGIIAQTIASGGSAALKITGGNVNFYSDASGYGGSYYQTGGVVTSKNKFLNITDSAIRTVTGGTLILDEGAQLMSDQLLISNVETDTNNNAKIIFNQNTKAKLTDLTALYDNASASTFNYFIYTNTDNNVEHKVALRAADVEINDEALIEKNAIIGNSKNSYMVRDLTLSKGATLNANITVHGGDTEKDKGASLTLGEGAVLGSKASISLKDYNSQLVISNTETPIEITGSVTNDGQLYKNTINKTGDGAVIIKGDMAGFVGEYNQAGGLVEFADGSSFFNQNTKSNVNSGELKINSKVSLKDGTIINVGEDGKFSTSYKSQVDLTGDTGSLITFDNVDVKVSLDKGAQFEVSNNSSVNAQLDTIIIGESGIVENLILGGSEKDGKVDVTVNDNSVFILENTTGEAGKSGILGFGENATFKNAAGQEVVPVVKLKDNTQLQFNNSTNSTINLKVQDIDNSGDVKTDWSDSNGDILKQGSGTITVEGSVNDFHGNLIVNNGEIVTSGTKFGTGTKFELSDIAPSADIKITNVTEDNDMTIFAKVDKDNPEISTIAPANNQDKYILNVVNSKGSISLVNPSGKETKTADLESINASKVSFDASGSFSAGNMKINDNSSVNVTATGTNSVGNISIKEKSSASITANNTNTIGDVTVENASKADIVSKNNTGKVGKITVANESTAVVSAGKIATIDNVSATVKSNVSLTAAESITAKNLVVDDNSVVSVSSKDAGTFTDINANNNSNAEVVSTNGSISAVNIYSVDTSKVQLAASGGDVDLSELKVENESYASLTSNGSIKAKKVSVINNSLLEVSDKASLDIVGDLLLKNSIIKMNSGNLNIGGNYTMGSTIDMMNGTINTQTIAGNMTLTDDSEYFIDVNPVAGTSDKVVISGNLSSDVAGVSRQLNIAKYNLITDPVAKYSLYKVFDVQGTITDVNFAISDNYVNSPIANYVFVPAGNTGSYLMARTGFTPTAMSVPAAMQIGGFLSQVQTYDEALGNLDTVMVLPTVGYYGNQYANANIDESVVYSPIFVPELEKGVWFRPYGNFERVGLEDGPRVDNQTYGVLAGGETALTELGNGYQGTLGAYVGYTGAHQSFNDISGYENGGLIGVTGALYKGGFFTGLTANVNAGGANISTPYGKTDFFMLSTGVASKTGYNWELGRGKFIIQPSWLMSYTYVNAFNPSEILNYDMDTEGLHGIQLVPGIKLMANLPEGWQPYLMCDFRLNLGDKTHFKMGGVSIDDTYVKSYIEYGLGMQKRWGERFTGFGQFLARNGGRNGVGVNLGLRWSVGQGR